MHEKTSIDRIGSHFLRTEPNRFNLWFWFRLHFWNFFQVPCCILLPVQKFKKNQRKCIKMTFWILFMKTVHFNQRDTPLKQAYIFTKNIWPQLRRSLSFGFRSEEPPTHCEFPSWGTRNLLWVPVPTKLQPAASSRSQKPTTHCEFAFPGIRNTETILTCHEMKEKVNQNISAFEMHKNNLSNVFESLGNGTLRNRNPHS